MATNSPGQSIHLKSPRSPRQLPQLPQIPIGGQRSPTQLSVSKSPGTPLVFEFPPEYYPETPNTNFDFEQFGRSKEGEARGPPRSPSYYSHQGCRSPKSPNPHSPGRKSPIFQFVESRRNLGKTMSYPPRSPASGSPAIPPRSPSSASFVPGKSVVGKPFEHRKNSCFSGLNGSKRDGMQAAIGLSSPKHEREKTSVEQREGNNASYKNGSRPGSVEGGGSSRERGDSPKRGKRSSHFNRSQGCLNEAENSQGESQEDVYGKNGRNISRRSTSDLTDMGDADTEVTLLSSPRRRGSMKGGLGEWFFGFFSFVFLFFPSPPPPFFFQFSFNFRGFFFFCNGKKKT